jgi:hypothetical protein
MMSKDYEAALVMVLEKIKNLGDVLNATDDPDREKKVGAALVALFKAAAESTKDG